MNDIVKIMMQDKYGNTAVMAMLNDFCDGKITPQKGVKFGVKLRCIHDTYFSPLKDALAKAEADKAVLVEALERCVCSLDEGCEHWQVADLLYARAALARVKESPCPKN